MTKIDETRIKATLDKKKFEICKEFEKICPTEVSLKRMVKQTHDIFDSIEMEIFGYKVGSKPIYITEFDALSAVKLKGDINE